MAFRLIFSQDPIKKLKEKIGIFVGIGISMALTDLFHMMAIVRIEVAYMISIKRTSPVFSVLIGCWLLHEKNFIEGFVGSIIMFLAVLRIIL